MENAARFRHLVQIRRRADVPLGDSDVVSEFSAQRDRWVDIQPVGAATYTEGIQTDHNLTHRIFLRWGDVIDTRDEVVHGESIYRVLRSLDHKGRRRLLILEVEQLQ